MNDNEMNDNRSQKILEQLFARLLISHADKLRYFERILNSMTEKPYLLIHNIVARCLMLSNESVKRGLSEIYRAGVLEKDFGRFFNQWISTIGFEDSLRRSNIREFYCAELFEGIDDISLPLKISNEASHHANHIDMMYVVAIAKHHGAKRLFEFGTYMGRTTCGLASISDDAVVFTLNLPPEEDPRYGPYIGQLIKTSPHRTRIHQIYCDSKTFLPESYARSMDYIFIDADHSYEGVQNDTEKALQMLAPGGVIVWHDYAPKSPGVYRYLCELSQDRSLFKIRNTCLVVYIDGVDVKTFTPSNAKSYLEDTI